jgi:Fe-S cluster biogenesis protein NfuA
MKQEDSERLARIETILSDVIAPQLGSYGPRIRELEVAVPELNTHGKRLRSLEHFRTVASVMWGGACVVGYVLKDTAAGWIKAKVLGHP